MTEASLPVATLLLAAARIGLSGVPGCLARRGRGAGQEAATALNLSLPMLALGAACVLLGLLPSAAVPLLQRAVAAWGPALPLPALAALVPFGWVSALGLLLLATVALLGALFARRRSPGAAPVTWDCGYAAPTRPLSRMRALQRGPVQMYLLYALLAAVTLLLVAP